MKALRGVLWDMDGVLVDTGEAHFQSWSVTFEERSIPFTREQFRTTFGMNNAGILEIILESPPSPDLLAEIGDRKESLFRDLVKGRVVLLPGVLDWLDRLRNQGFRQAIASSAPYANIDAVVGELGIGTYFAALVSGADLPGKPDPAVFFKAADLIGVPPACCVVVEDAVAGVEAAKRGGMKCIAVTTTNPPNTLREADVVIEQLDALPADAFVHLL